MSRRYVTAALGRAAPRGHCPVCGRELALRKDGTVRAHDSWQWRSGRPMLLQCTGVGLAADPRGAPMTEEEATPQPHSGKGHAQ